jgi:nucleotide-binding universal stress UspA family protein
VTEADRAGSVVVVGVDFSDCGSRAFDAAVEQARAIGAQLVLVHATQGSIPYDTLALGAPSLAKGAAQRATDLARQRLDQLVLWAEGEGVPCRGVLAHDKPAEAIATEAAKEGVRLVVVGTHGHNAVARAIMGSTAQKVVRKSRLPVLVVPRRD